MADLADWVRDVDPQRWAEAAKHSPLAAVALLTFVVGVVVAGLVAIYWRKTKIPFEPPPGEEVTTVA